MTCRSGRGCSGCARALNLSVRDGLLIVKNPMRRREMRVWSPDTKSQEDQESGDQVSALIVGKLLFAVTAWCLPCRLDGRSRGEVMPPPSFTELFRLCSPRERSTRNERTDFRVSGAGKESVV